MFAAALVFHLLRAFLIFHFGRIQDFTIVHGLQTHGSAREPRWGPDLRPHHRRWLCAIAAIRQASPQCIAGMSRWRRELTGCVEGVLIITSSRSTPLVILQPIPAVSILDCA